MYSIAGHNPAFFVSKLFQIKIPKIPEIPEITELIFFYVINKNKGLKRQDVFSLAGMREDLVRPNVDFLNPRTDLKIKV